MEGRKRKGLATSSDELSSSKKMKEETEENPLDPSVLTFQNAAMSVRIEEYKNEINALNQRIESMNAKQSAFDKIISTVNKQWDLLNDNLNVFMIRIGKGDQVQDQAGLKGSAENPPSFLDVLLRTDSRGFTDNTSFIEEALQKRNNRTKDVLLKISEALEELRSRSDEFLQKIANAVGKETNLRELVSENLVQENERLNKQIREGNIRENALQNSYQNLKEDVEALKESKLALEQRNKEIKTECDDAIVKLELAQRRAERYRLAVEQGGPGFLRLSSSTSSLKNSGSLTSSSSSTTAPPPPVANGHTTDEQKTFEAEVKDARELAESRLQEIQKLREGRTNLLKDLNRLRQELAVIPDERIFKSHLCQMLQHQAQTATAELLMHRQQSDRLQQNLQTLAAQHRQAVEKFEVEELKRREPVEKELREAKALIANLKNEVNDLTYRFEKAKTLQPNEKLISELKNLLQTQEKQIKKLTQDCERYRADSQQLKILKKEFKEMEEKLVDLLEQKVQEHSLAMAELTALKSKSSNPQEMTTAAEAKASSESALAIELEHLRKKLARMEETAAEQKANLDSQQKETDLLMTEIESISKAYDEMHDTSSRLATQITEKEDINTQLLSERVKLKQIVDILKQEKQLLQDKLVKLDERCSAQAELIQKLETQHRTLQDAHYKTVEELKVAVASVDGHKRLCRETSQASGEMRVQIDHLKGMLDDLRKQSLDSTVALEKEQNKYLRLEEERNALKKKLDRLESKTPQADSLVEEELKMLKKQMRCPVCNDNNKNAVIAKCYHCFCRPCIQKNLDCRIRKCPACKKQFGESDVHSIWLE